MAIDLTNQHAAAHTRLIGFAVWVNLRHDNALRAVVTELLGQVRREVLWCTRYNITFTLTA